MSNRENVGFPMTQTGREKGISRQYCFDRVRISLKFKGVPKVRLRIVRSWSVGTLPLCQIAAACNNSSEARVSSEASETMQVHIGGNGKTRQQRQEFVTRKLHETTVTGR